MRRVPLPVTDRERDSGEESRSWKQEYIFNGAGERERERESKIEIED